MGQRTKGGMWCKVDGPVLGVKNTHRIRNASSLLVPLGPLLFAKVEGYFCPKCGGRVRPAWMMAGRVPQSSANARISGWINGSVLPADTEVPEAMVTPDRRWISFDGGEHYQSTATSPPPAAPVAP